MAILNFQKPDKVIMIDSSEFEGKFEFRPLEPGYGLTVGNALRRVLLSSLEGFAITSIKLENVDHEFSTISGVVEDVTEIILNLKQVRFKRQIEETEEEKPSDIEETTKNENNLHQHDLQINQMQSLPLEESENTSQNLTKYPNVWNKNRQG